MYPYSGEVKETPTLLGPVESPNLDGAVIDASSF
jgi:hypothetical protein